jgi:hypothetical protein
VRRSFVVAAVVAMGVIAPSTAAAAPVTCEGLQAALGAATDGSTVTLAKGEFCSGHYQPAEVTITIEGELDSNGHAAAGFQPAAAAASPDRSMYVDSHTATTTIRNLIFRGPSDHQVDSGGLRVNGNGGSLILEGLTFDGIRQSGSGGGLLVDLFGPVTVTGSTFSNNDAGVSGGGARIDAQDAVISASVFIGNEAGQHGGGLALTTAAFRDVVTRAPDGLDAQLNGNDFSGNLAAAPADINEQPPPPRSVPPAPVDITGRGGGLFVGKSGDAVDGQQGRIAEVGGNPPVVELNDNRYDLNAIAATRQIRTGGGLELAGVDVNATGEEIIRNDVLGDANNDDRAIFMEGGEGGGLSIHGGQRDARLELTNTAVAGNTVGQDGYGAGIYTGCNECGTEVTLTHTTVSGNSGGAGSTAPGIGGDPGDQLTLVNSIVIGNFITTDAVVDDVQGFGAYTAEYSDVCNIPQGSRADANGNICVDPKLANPEEGDVHQTVASPTIDAAVGAENLTVDEDYESDLRPTLVSNRSGTPYDMGADEFMSADYKVALEATPNPVLSGENVTLKATVTNNGPSPAKSVTASFALGGATLVSTSTTKGTCSGAVTCHLGDLASGQSVVVTIVIKAPTVSGRASASLVTSVTVSSTTDDPTLGDHTASRTITVNSKPVVAAPTPTPAPSGGQLPAAAAKKCGSRRFFTIRVRLRKDRVVKASITVNGKKAKVRKSGGRLKTTVDLKFLPKSTITVRIKATTKSGKKLSGKRVYHPCSPKREGSVPEL